MGRRVAVPKYNYFGAQGLDAPESSILDGVLASHRGTGGMVDCGTFKEDTPVTWETPDLPWAKPGTRRPRKPDSDEAFARERVKASVKKKRSSQGRRGKGRPEP